MAFTIHELPFTLPVNSKIPEPYSPPQVSKLVLDFKFKIPINPPLQLYKSIDSLWETLNRGKLPDPFSTVLQMIKESNNPKSILTAIKLTSFPDDRLSHSLCAILTLFSQVLPGDVLKTFLNKLDIPLLKLIQLLPHPRNHVFSECDCFNRNYFTWLHRSGAQ